jgi:hypothetical protein
MAKPRRASWTVGPALKSASSRCQLRRCRCARRLPAWPGRGLAHGRRQPAGRGRSASAAAPGQGCSKGGTPFSGDVQQHLVVGPGKVARKGPPRLRQHRLAAWARPRPPRGRAADHEGPDGLATPGRGAARPRWNSELRRRLRARGQRHHRQGELLQAVGAQPDGDDGFVGADRRPAPPSPARPGCARRAASVALQASTTASNGSPSTCQRRALRCRPARAGPDAGVARAPAASALAGSGSSSASGAPRQQQVGAAAPAEQRVAQHAQEHLALACASGVFRAATHSGSISIGQHRGRQAGAQLATLCPVGSGSRPGPARGARQQRQAVAQAPAVRAARAVKARRAVPAGSCRPAPSG